MSLERLLTQTFEILGYVEGARDQLNNPTDTWTDPGVVEPAYLEQRKADEQTQDRDTRISTYLLILEATAQIGPRDRGRDEDGRLYEVVGDPAHVWNPRSAAVHHIEATLQRIEGSAGYEETSS